MDRFGHVPSPAELAAKSREDPAALGPLALHRMARDLEPPADDEGFAEIRIEPFVREHRAQDDARPGLLLPLEALEALNGARVADVMTSAPPRAPPRRSGCRSSRSASAGQPG